MEPPVVSDSCTHYQGMKFPGPYYMAIARSVDVRYYLSMAEGAYGTPLKANIPDVVAVTKLAVNPGSEIDATK